MIPDVPNVQVVPDVEMPEAPKRLSRCTVIGTGYEAISSTVGKYV